jgi:hypothetical protein
MKEKLLRKYSAAFLLRISLYSAPTFPLTIFSSNITTVTKIFRFLEYLSTEIDHGKDVEWNMQWLKNIIKF